MFFPNVQTEWTETEDLDIDKDILEPPYLQAQIYIQKQMYYAADKCIESGVCWIKYCFPNILYDVSESEGPGSA